MSHVIFYDGELNRLNKENKNYMIFNRSGIFK